MLAGDYPMPSSFDPFERGGAPGGVPHPMAAGELQEWERTYSMFMHLTTLVMHTILVPIVPALIMWQIKKDESAFVRDHGKEVLNFQISLLIYGLVCVPLIYACGIGIPLMLGVYALGIFGMVMGAVAANKGRYYRYPACLRLIG